MEKNIEKKVIENLALQIASKTGLDDSYATVARKVIADYVGARRIIREYNASIEKAEKGKPKKKSEKKKAGKDEPATAARTPKAASQD